MSPKNYSEFVLADIGISCFAGAIAFVFGGTEQQTLIIMGSVFVTLGVLILTSIIIFKKMQH